MPKHKPQSLHRCYHQDPNLGMCKRCASLIPIFDKWRYRLRLMDWDILFIVREPGAIKDRSGQVDVQTLLKSATMEIRDDRLLEIGEPTSKPYGTDTETTIVHELLHVHFNWMIGVCCCFGNQDSTENMLFEQTVETLAKSLVDIDRGVR